MNTVAEIKVAISRLTVDEREELETFLSDLSEQEEDRIAELEAEAALAEPGEDIPWDQLKKELNALYGQNPAAR